MAERLWVPSRERIARTNLYRFMNAINARQGLKLSDYNALYRWSIENIFDFWAAMWDVGGVIASRPYTEVVDDVGKMPGARWFGGGLSEFCREPAVLPGQAAGRMIRWGGLPISSRNCLPLKRSLWSPMPLSTRISGVCQRRPFSMMISNPRKTVLRLNSDSFPLSIPSISCILPEPPGCPSAWSRAPGEY